MQHRKASLPRTLILLAVGLAVTAAAYSQESFSALVARMKAAKPDIMKHHMALLEERYDLSNRPAPGVTMSRGKSVQAGVRAKLPAGITWERLAAMTPKKSETKTSSPGASSPCRTRTIPKAGWCSQSSILTK